MTLDYGSYGTFLIMGDAGLISLNHIDPLKEPLTGTLIDPFKRETPGFISSAVWNILSLRRRRANGDQD